MRIGKEESRLYIASFCDKINYHPLIHEAAMRNTVYFGFAGILAFCFFSAVGRVLTGALDQQVHPVVLAFGVFSISASFFALSNARQLPALWGKVCAHRADVLLVNMTTCFAWLFLFYPLKYIEPAIVSSITLGLGPFCMILLLFLFEKKRLMHPANYWMAALMTGVIVYLVFLIFSGKTAMHTLVNSKTLSYALLCCILVAVAVAANTWCSKRLSNAGFAPLDILSCRFFLLLIVALAWIAAERLPVPLAPPSLLLNLLLDSFFLAILPIYCFYTGLPHLQPVTITLLIPLMPVFTFFLEFFDQRLAPGKTVIILIIAIAVLASLSSFFQYQVEKKQAD